MNKEPSNSATPQMTRPFVGAPRIDSLDFLRGLYLFLAGMQHFAGYLNTAGLQLDWGASMLFWLLTPSGDQVFLALAAFNLAKRSRDDFRSVYLPKVSVYASLFVFFFFEGFFRSFDLGGALTWSALLTWMVILILIASLYRFTGVRGVVALFVLQCGFWLLPFSEWNAALTVYVRRTLFLPSFFYDAALDLFVGSGCVGFLLGYWYAHCRRPGAKWLFAPFALGLLMQIPFAIAGTFWELSPTWVWLGEYYVAEQFTGIVSIWGIELALIAFALGMGDIGWPLRAPIINWAGRYSLLIFAFHQTFFVRVLLPVRFHFGELLGYPPTARLIELATFVLITFFFCWLLLRSGLLLLMQRQGAGTSTIALRTGTEASSTSTSP
ncbi:MAG: hypothetical protein KDD44_02960 [Bdellovibrionales bacterium]|nr:hypothetical protein [Bdellovibrionales bacterium]